MSRTFYAGFGALLAAVACSLIVPQAQLWGLHFLSFYPASAQMLFTVCAALVIAAGFWKHWLPRFSLSWTFSPLLGDIIVTLLCGLIFLTFAAKTALLGDGQLWLNEIPAESINYLRSRAPFTLLLLRTLYAWLNPLTGISAERLFALTSATAGVTAVLGWLRLARFLKINRAICLLLVFSWGGIELFFGYIETYTITAAILTWMLVLMVISLREAKPSWLVPILGVLAAGFNFSAIVFLPALAIYCQRVFFGKPLRARHVLIGSGSVFMFAAVAYFVFGWYKGTDILLPFMRTGGIEDAVLSVKHLVDLMNGLLLVAGAFFVLLAAYIVDELRAGFRWTDEKLILMVALIFPLTACIMHNPQLGMARDWDICALLLVSAPVISLVIWNVHPPLAKFAGRPQTLLGAWLLVVIVPWIGVQASETRSVQRFKDLLRREPARSVTGWDYLTSYYFHRGRLEEWGQCTLEALRLSDNPRYHGNAALYFATKRDWPHAREQAELAHAGTTTDTAALDWKKGVTDPTALLALGNSFRDRADANDAQQAYEVAARLQPESPWPEILIADLQIRCSDLSSAQRTVARLAAKNSAAIEDAQKYFANMSRNAALDRQCTGWLGLCLIARVRNDFAEVRNDAQKALTICRDEQMEQLRPEIEALMAPAKP